jgi:hypothetical protein
MKASRARVGEAKAFLTSALGGGNGKLHASAALSRNRSGPQSRAGHSRSSSVLKIEAVCSSRTLKS